MFKKKYILKLKKNCKKFNKISMVSIYVYCSEQLKFFSSIKALNDFLNSQINDSDFLLEEDDDETVFKFIYNFDVIKRYNFNDNEELSFMECVGPSSECCFLIKKSSFDFYKEMADYMQDCKKTCFDVGDRIVCKIQEFDSYKKITFINVNGELDNDLMQFSLISDISIV